MKATWIAAAILGLMPAVASAGHHSSFFGFSIGFGNSGYCGDYSYARFGYGYGGCYPRSYCAPRIYAPAYYAPPVVYAPPPVVYSPPVYYSPAPVYSAPPVYYTPAPAYSETRFYYYGR
jgi:hypothetical protein